MTSDIGFDASVPLRNAWYFQRLARREPPTSASPALQRLPRALAIGCALRLDLAIVGGL